MNAPYPAGNTSPVTQAADRAHDAVDHAAASAAPIIEKASGAAHRTIERAAEIARPAADWVNDSGQELAQRSSAAVATVGGFVRQQQMVTLAAVALIGYFIGKFTR
jgi:ElaB/YqjD/DUF883 family membrane-anchored ribosome-binding protein